jgi:hypothetical protein
MKLLRAKRFWFVVLSGTTLAIVLGISIRFWNSPDAGYLYRRCGHRPELKARLLVLFPYWQLIKRTERTTSYLTVHGCSGDRARSALESVAFAQQGFQAKFGRPADSLSELGKNASRFRIEYQNSRDGWCASIAQQADLPGYYIAVSSGVYFSEKHRPSTNDYALTFFK